MEVTLALDLQKNVAELFDQGCGRLFAVRWLGRPQLGHLDGLAERHASQIVSRLWYVGVSDALEGGQKKKVKGFIMGRQRPRARELPELSDHRIKSGLGRAEG
eukprot:scaffold18456_cov124-Isochrysis_galbana.AAC.6